MLTKQKSSGHVLWCLNPSKLNEKIKTPFTFSGILLNVKLRPSESSYFMTMETRGKGLAWFRTKGNRIHPRETLEVLVDAFV